MQEDTVYVLTTHVRRGPVTVLSMDDLMWVLDNPRDLLLWSDSPHVNEFVAAEVVEYEWTGMGTKRQPCTQAELRAVVEKGVAMMYGIEIGYRVTYRERDTREMETTMCRVSIQRGSLWTIQQQTAKGKHG